MIHGKAREVLWSLDWWPPSCPPTKWYNPIHRWSWLSLSPASREMCQRHSKTKKSLQNQSRSAIKTKKIRKQKTKQRYHALPGLFFRTTQFVYLSQALSGWWNGRYENYDEICTQLIRWTKIKLYFWHCLQYRKRISLFRRRNHSEYRGPRKESSRYVLAPWTICRKPPKKPRWTGRKDWWLWAPW